MKNTNQSRQNLTKNKLDT